MKTITIKIALTTFCFLLFIIKTQAQYYFNIDAPNGKLLNKSIHSAGAEDIFFTPDPTVPNPCTGCAANYKYFDINNNTAYPIFYENDLPGGTGVYKTLISSLGFNSIQYSGGSTSSWDHYGTGATNGYNMNSSELNNNSCKPVNCSAMYSTGTYCFTNDFFTDYTNFIKNIGTKSALIANVHTQSINLISEITQKIEYVKSITGQFPERVSLGAEQSLPDNEGCWILPDAYATFAGSWFPGLQTSYPSIKYTFDANPTFDPNPNQSTWNAKILDNLSLNSNVTEGRLYLWNYDIFNNIFQAPPNMNRVDDLFENTGFGDKTIEQFINVTNGQFLAWSDVFPSKLPAVWQWGIKDNDVYMHQNMLGCIYISRFYMWMMNKNLASPTNNYIPYASYINLNDLLKPKYAGSFTLVKQNTYEAINLIGKLFSSTNAYQYPISSVGGLTKVYAVVTGNRCPGNPPPCIPFIKSYTLLLVNENSTAKTISPTRVNGVEIALSSGSSGWSLTQTGISATDLNSNSTHFTPSTPIVTTTNGPITLPAYSITLLSYVTAVPHKKESAFSASKPFEVEIYPNPGTEIVNIVAGEDITEMSIQVLDVNNQVRISEHFNTSNATLNVRELPNGVYFIKLYSPDRDQLFKTFIKQ